MKYIALDTETYKGRAFLLTTATHALRFSSFSDFIRIVSSLGTKFVFYNLDYDVSAVCKHLPAQTAARVFLDRAVLWRGVWLRYIPGKVFSFTVDGKKHECFDVYPFFQCSLDEAAKKYLGKEKQSLPDGLIANLSPENYKAHKGLIDSYAMQDSRLLQELTNAFVMSLESTGLRTNALYSPGYLAKAYIRKRKITIPPVPDQFSRTIARTYYGGRIEVAKRGFTEQAKIYDLKSAYPWAMRDIPDLSNCTYSLSSEIDSDLFLAECDLDITAKIANPIPIRANGLNVFPNLRARKWITCYEYEKLGRPPVLQALNIHGERTYPFRPLIDELFSMRKKSGMEGLIYKLILNSLYGITAEKKTAYFEAPLERVYSQLLYERTATAFDSLLAFASKHCPNAWRYWEKKCACEYCHTLRIAKRNSRKTDPRQILEFDGHFWASYKRHGKLSNLLIAALITARVRMAVYDVIKKAGKSYIASFTDSLICDARFSLPINGGGIGAWEQKYVGPILVIGSGVYETNDETKFRGFRVKRTDENPRPLRKLLENLNGTKVKVDQMDRLSFGQFVRTGYQSYTHFNILTPAEKVLDINFDHKREWERDFISGADALESLITSRPLSITLK